MLTSVALLVLYANFQLLNERVRSTGEEILRLRESIGSVVVLQKKFDSQLTITEEEIGSLPEFIQRSLTVDVDGGREARWFAYPPARIGLPGPRGASEVHRAPSRPPRSETAPSAALVAEAELAALIAAAKRAAEEIEGTLSKLRKQSKLWKGQMSYRDRLPDGSMGPEMVVVLPRHFLMGSPESESERSKDEGPRRRVEFERVFALGRYEVTVEEYDKCVGARVCRIRSDKSGRGKQPIDNVNWEDGHAYARWLSKETGKRYRLPTEAEWEYAARAGSTTRYWWGEDVGSNRAHCIGCGSEWDRKQAAPVGSFAPNAFGLHDTVGNVWEWVQDCWHENYEDAPTDGSAWLEENGGDCGLRVIRGGSWGLKPDRVRSAYRGRALRDGRGDFIGLRLALDL